MTFLLPYLGAAHGDGCVEVMNNCRTLAYMSNMRLPGWDLPSGGRCPHCCCPAYNEDSYTTPADFSGVPAPWADPNVPASAEFVGFLLDHDGFEIENAESTRLLAEGGRPRITLTGTLISTTSRGHTFGYRWVREQLIDPCGGGCAGISLLGFEHCRDGGLCEDPCPEESDGCCDELIPWCFDDDGVLIEDCRELVGDIIPERCIDTDGRLRCYEPEPVDRGTVTPETIDCPVSAPEDPGIREVPGVRLLSIDPLDDGSAAGPHCSGARYVIVLEMSAAGKMLGCGLTHCRVSTWEESWCEPAPMIITQTLGLGCETCGIPCRCAPEIQEEILGDGLPVPSIVDSSQEPDALPVLKPKPVIEPAPPDCPESVQCALDNGMVIDFLTGYIDLAASGIPTSGAHTWFPDGSGPSWLNRMVAFLECVGTTWSSTDAGNVGTLEELMIGCSSVSPSPTSVTVEMNFAGGIRFAPTATPGGLGAADCNAILSDPAAMESFNFQGSPYSSQDLDCILGTTCVKPLYNGADIGDFIFPFDPDGLLWEGTVYTDPAAWVAAFSAARGCPVTWNDEFHPTDPCTYCIPNDCPRQPVANLETPPRCVTPTVDGETPTGPIPWPLLYSGVEIGSGADLADFLTQTRGCEITWDDSQECYILPIDCPTGPIVNLVSPGDIQETGDCYEPPTQIIRQACLVPAVPESYERDTVIRLINGEGRLENASIRVYPLIEDLPHILHSDGAAAYWSIEPVAEYRIAGLAPYSELRIDGIEGTVEEVCIDGQVRSAGAFVFGPDRTPARPPCLGCGCYWVELVLSCEESSDGAGFAYGALDAALDVATKAVARP